MVRVTGRDLVFVLRNGVNQMNTDESSESSAITQSYFDKGEVGFLGGSLVVPGVGR